MRVASSPLTVRLAAPGPLIATSSETVSGLFRRIVPVTLKSMIAACVANAPRSVQVVGLGQPPESARDVTVIDAGPAASVGDAAGSIASRSTMAPKAAQNGRQRDMMGVLRWLAWAPMSGH